MIIARIISLLIGYIFGLFQTGYIYGKSKGMWISVQKAAEMQARPIRYACLGGKQERLLLLGDLLKAIFAVLLIKLIFGGIVIRC